MYGDFLVPENTNVNNAITTRTGAKWEKVETLEINGGERIVYDVDTDNKTPLNINGFMIVANLITNQSIRLTLLKDDSTLVARTGFVTASAPKGILKVVNNNGICHCECCLTSSTSSYLQTQVVNFLDLEVCPFNNHKLDFTLTGTDETTLSLTGTLDIYFLRGV